MILYKSTKHKGFKAIIESVDVHVFTKGKDTFKANKHINLASKVDHIQGAFLDLKDERKKEARDERMRKRNAYKY